MRKLLLISATALCLTVAQAQKLDKENFKYYYTHIPEKLIYDQIKTFGSNVTVVPAAVFTLDNTYASSIVGGFTSFEKVPYEKADMQIQASFGPYIPVEEKTAIIYRSEEINKVKTSVTYYKRVHSFRFPIVYTLTNAKNGIKLFSYEYPSTSIRTIETQEYRTEQEAVNAFNQNKLASIKNDVNMLCTSITGTCYNATRELYDFYPSGYIATIYQFKKWDKADEYNAHVKNVIKTFAVMTADEKAAAYKEKINADLLYFSSFEGLFKPTDKSEDILYYGNYYNLSLIYNALDDYKQAKYYLQKLDSSDKERSATASLKTLIEKNIRKTERHFLEDQHLNYNPVSDYRLGDKKFVSDALSSTEKLTQSLTEGETAANDKLLTSEGKELFGKIFVEKETGTVKLLSADDPEESYTITVSNTNSFSKDGVDYLVAKASLDAVLQKRFYKIEYSSDQIKLLQLLNNDLSVTPDYLGLLRPTDNLVHIMMGLSVKKGLTKYFEDCPTVSSKAKEGEFGGSIYGSGGKNRLSGFIQMCEEYSNCK